MSMLLISGISTKVAIPRQKNKTGKFPSVSTTPMPLLTEVPGALGGFGDVCYFCRELETLNNAK